MKGYRKKAIPNKSRREIAMRYGCRPGQGSAVADCHYCGKQSQIHWPLLYSGKPSSWVTFTDLEIDHYQPELHGGKASSDNLVLACRRCNRTKGAKAPTKTKPAPNHASQ